MNEDFRDLIRALSEAEARFLVVGAHAVAVHAEPRATGDIDIWVEASADNARRVMRALREFGAPLHDLSDDDLASPGIVFQMGLPPRRIDLLTSITGVRFEEAWPGRVEVTDAGLTFPVIGREALVRNKECTDRPKDRLDLDLLRKHR